MEAVHQVMGRLERRWSLPIPDASVWHAYDPLPIALFLPGLRRAAELTDGRRFLDVGCGVGRNMALAHSLGWEVAGIDRVAHYVDAARELLPEAVVMCQDAFAVPRFAADVVYMYRPARADDLEDSMETHVLERVTPGTVCFFPTRRNPEVWVA